MKKLIIAFVLGFTLGGGLCWAAMSVTLVDGIGNALGTTSNPLYTS